MKIMKKIKTTTAILLTLMLALSGFSINVKAEPGSDADGGYVIPPGFSINVKAEPTINTGRTGSLTIYQYGMEDISGAGSAGTGETRDEGSVPAGSKPLQGVQYTIYKVEELSSYYGTSSSSLPTVDEAQEKVNKEGITGISATTGADGKAGKATFTNLSLGLYLVKVTASNKNVTQEVAPF